MRSHSLEHIGSNIEVMKRGWRFRENLEAMTRDRAEVLGRPRDVAFALDQAAGWTRDYAPLRGRLDLERVGMLGHSFGAYTTLVVCGARPALDWLQPRPHPAASGPGAIGATGLGPELRDPRVRCGVALSPQGPGEPFFLETSYATLSTPLLGISGSEDKQQGAAPALRRRGFALWPASPDRLLIWLGGADHTAFSDATGASGRRMLPSAARADVQPLCRAATLRFFDLHLRGDTTARDELAAPALQRYRRGQVSAIEVLTR